MQEIFEKIRERLERERDIHKSAYDVAIQTYERAGYASYARACDEAIKIVNQVADEYVKKTYKFGNSEQVINQSLTNNNQSLTNADKIRSMTDEELAEFLFEQTHCDYCNIRTKCRQIDADNCHDVFLVWLQSEVEE